MEISEILKEERIQYIIKNSEESIIIVHTVLSSMSFESPRGFPRIYHPEEGIYIIHLNSGTNIVNFESDGSVSQKN